MVSLQEWLEQQYPNKSEVTEIIFLDRVGFDGKSLVINDYPKLEEININLDCLESLTITNCSELKDIAFRYSKINDIDLSNCPNLISIDIPENQFTSISFLNTLPNLEKLSVLNISNNNIQPTTLDFLRTFVNLEAAFLGTDNDVWRKGGKTNLFYGSLEPCKHLTKLEVICIANTDIDSGLEYLPDKLVKMSKETLIGKNDFTINCENIRPDAKVKALQDQLRPFNYDLEAWRLANVNLVNSAERIQQLETKIKETQAELADTQQNQSEKTKKIARLESKLAILEETKSNLERENKQLITELTQLKKDKENLTNQLAVHVQTIAQSQQKLTELQAETSCLKDQLAQKQKEWAEKNQLYQDKDNKITKLNADLTALAVSTGILTQQCEDLTKQLSVSEQASQRKQLELAIKENLLSAQDNSLTQQEQQIKDYELLLRQSEVNLSKCQKIISQKSDQLEQLEQEKNNLQTQLEQAETQINQLENSLSTAQTRISELEEKIKDLETKGDNSDELTRLKAELASLKSSSRQEVDSLKNQLTQAKVKEQALLKQIQALTSKNKEKNEIETATNSAWAKVKTLLIFVGGIIALIAIINYFKKKN